MSGKETCTAGYDWCHTNRRDCGGDHSSMTYQQATLGQGAAYRLDDGARLMIGTGVRFNAHDGEAGPSITVHIEGGPEGIDVQVDLRINEAYAFSRLLDTALVDATTAALGQLPATLAADWFEGVQ